MQRRIFGEEDITEPSRFLNELPLELMQNLSQGPSWLGFAVRPETLHNREAAAAMRGESPAVKKTSNYSGKTYNSVDGVREFFRSRSASARGSSEGTAGHRSGRAEGRRSGRGESRDRQATSDSQGQFKVGARVRHAKYGSGVVLRSEGAGDDAKLTVSFPGYGQKKFVAKFAALEKE
jgi:DNA helicase-2/ATP-dependent DNA helicase PcrA